MLAIETRIVRAIHQKGRIRLRDELTGLFVQCSRDWREALTQGATLTIRARLRADRECWVMAGRD